MNGGLFCHVIWHNICSFSVRWLKCCTWEVLCLKTQLLQQFISMHAHSLLSFSTLESLQSKEGGNVMQYSAEDMFSEYTRYVVAVSQC